MEMEYRSSSELRDLESANAYWKELSGLGSRVHFDARSSNRSLVGHDSANFSSSSRFFSFCICLDNLIFN